VPIAAPLKQGKLKGELQIANEPADRRLGDMHRRGRGLYTASDHHGTKGLDLPRIEQCAMRLVECHQHNISVFHRQKIRFDIICCA
jgi:hypothetical protein